VVVVVVVVVTNTNADNSADGGPICDEFGSAAVTTDVDVVQTLHQRSQAIFWRE